MTVPVKEGYEQIVYHCDVKTNNKKKTPHHHDIKISKYNNILDFDH